MGEVETAKSAATRRAFDRAIAEAQRLIGKGRLEEADRELDRAERLRPGEVPTRYYRGLLAYKRREYRAAEYYLKAAIALDRRDSWSTYMLALTRGELGDAPGARARLVALAQGSPDPAVRATASRALQALDRTERVSRHYLDARVEVGSALDTNPAYVDESSASLQDAALALHVAGRLSYQHRASDRIHMGGGLRLLERNYAVGDEGAASTELDVALSLLASGSVVRLGISAGYLLQLYGHQPFCSVPASELQLSIGLRPWLAALAGVHLSYRIMHNGDYEHLQALTAGGSLGVRGSWNKVSLELTYFAQHGGSPDVSRSVTDASSVTYRLATDYSAWGHGPRLALLAHLPWRLRLFASVGLALRHFSTADVLVRTDNGTTTRLDARRDETLAADAELARALPRGFEVALRFESVDNFSTIQRTDPVALDYNYSRRLAGLVLGWTWPVSAGP